MAVVTFGRCLYMEFRFTNGGFAIVTTAANTKYRKMIDKLNLLKPKRGMTGLTGIAGSDMIA